MDASTGALINVTDGINAVHSARSQKVVSADLAKTEHAAALAEIRAAMAMDLELTEEWYELAKTIVDQAMIAVKVLDQDEIDELHAGAPWLNDFATKAKAAALDKSSKAKVNDRMFQPACTRIASTYTASGSMTKCNNDTKAARALDMRKLAMIDKHAHTQLLKRGCELEHAVIHQRSDSNGRRLCIARCCYSRWIDGQFYYICPWALIRCKVFSAAHYALLQESAFLIVTRGTKHAIMRSGYDGVQIMRPITDEVRDELAALEDCEQDILLGDGEDLKTMLVNNKRTAVVAGRFWSDSQLELEPWACKCTRVHERTAA